MRCSFITLFMFTLIASIIAGVLGIVGIGVAADQNNKTRESNEKVNEQNIAEAEKSYQRSRPSAQVADLVSAGMTEQQARNIVASRGSAAAYSAPSLTPTESGVDMSGILSGIGQLGSGVQSLGSFFDADRKDPTGGLVGSSLIEKPAAIISEHLDDLPTEASTLSGFLKFAKSANAPEWCKDLVKSSEWRKCLNNVQGNRALRSFFTETSQIASTGLGLTGAQIQNRMNSTRAFILDEELSQATMETIQKDLQTKLSLETAPLVTRSTIASLKTDCLRFETDERLWSDPAYRNAYIATMLKDQENQVVLASISRSIYDGQLEWLNKPENASVLGILQLLGKAGVTSTDWGCIWAVAEASGIPIAEGVKDAVAPIVAGARAIVEDIPEAVESFTGSVGSAVNVAGQYVSDQKIYDLCYKSAAAYENWYNTTFHGSDTTKYEHALTKHLPLPEAHQK